MLRTTTSRPNTLHLAVCLSRRPLTTETVSSSSTPPPPPPATPPSAKSRSRIGPSPRPATSHRHPPIPSLPASFGKNQLLPVSNSTRALLESVVSQFNAPIRYAFAYGSGVFEQDGYTREEGGPKPMLDFMLAVRHPDHWHSINMSQHPSHYAMHARLLGSSFVSKLESYSPGVWFNTYVKMQDVTIKYGVTSIDNLCADLLGWRTLYLAGRMHKPLRIIKDDARVRLTQQVNLTSAVRTALLTLPDKFSERELFETIAGISYNGDVRMLLPAENRGKVGNIVRKQNEQFHELYHRLVVALPGTHWSQNTDVIEQDTSPQARAAHLKKLPKNLLDSVVQQYASSGPGREADESAYWVRVAGDQRLSNVIRQETARIVRYPAFAQTVKGLVSAGVAKSFRYSSEKVGKWWEGSRRP